MRQIFLHINQNSLSIKDLSHFIEKNEEIKNQTRMSNSPIKAVNYVNLFTAKKRERKNQITLGRCWIP